MSANVCIIIAIVVYLGAMLYVGFAFSKNNNNAEDFYLGGRKMGPFVTAMVPRRVICQAGFLWDFREWHIFQEYAVRHGRQSVLELERGLTGFLYREGFADIQAISGL